MSSNSEAIGLQLLFMARVAHDAITIIASDNPELAKILGDRYQTIIGHRDRP